MLNGIKKGPVGEVIVDEHMRTSVPDVYACGDVIGPPYLTPVARHQGIVAADNILGIPRTMDYRFIPQSINLSQELAFCSSVTENTASLAIPGQPGRARSGQSLPVTPALQRYLSIARMVQSTAYVPQVRGGALLQDIWHFS